MPTRRASADVDNYIAAFPPAVRVILQRVRRVVRAAAPGATEVISYRMPALKQNAILVYFAAFKNHIGFYPPVTGDARLEKAAARYAGKKGNLRFPLEEPIPYALIGHLTTLRAKQDIAKASAARSKSPSRGRATPAGLSARPGAAPGAGRSGVHRRSRITGRRVPRAGQPQANDRRADVRAVTRGARPRGDRFSG